MPKLTQNIYDSQSEEFTKTIRKAMAEHGVKQTHLAKELHKTDATVSKWLKDIDIVQLGELRKIANKLGLTIKIE